MPIEHNNVFFPAANDIVDLNDRDARFERIHPRFFKRVFTEKEQQVARQNPRLFYWAIWAAKEAAFKWVVQKQGNTVFSHKLFEVDENLSFVSYQNQKIDVEIFYNTEFVWAQSFSFASLQNLKKKHTNFRTNHFISDLSAWNQTKNTPKIQKILQIWQQQNPCQINFDNELSIAVRVLATVVLAEVTSLPAHKIYIKKRNKIPYAFVFNQKQPLPFVLSFSHHGNFYAFLLAGNYSKPPANFKQSFIPLQEQGQKLIPNEKKLS